MHFCHCNEMTTHTHTHTQLLTEETMATMFCYR